ncbi:MAG: hypothetical protein F4013_05250 [Gammaproteobacteria bacterium]|nr:hypothetical protein [Gammaproteobacteria bacterium]MYL01110.1 hypothetical protein [Gammaproteobacteria bacterium]
MRTPVLLLACLQCAGAAAQEEAEASFDRFKLWNGCASTRLIVESLSDDADEIGLEHEDVVVAVRSRLRAARIYNTDESGPYLYVQVNVVSRSFSINVMYSKVVIDVATELPGSAMTWTTGVTGSHGGDSGYVLSVVYREIDRFIDEYLRVNAEACS